MKYKIIYDKPGRIRIRSGKYAFGVEHVPGIAEQIKCMKGISNVVCTSLNGGILITYAQEEINKKEIFSFLTRLNVSETAIIKPSADEANISITNDFVFSISKCIIKHFVGKLFLPFEIKRLVTMVKSLKYIKAGMKSLSKGKINVSVLDAVSVSASVLKRSYGVAASVMLLMSISELLEEYTRKRSNNLLAQSLTMNIDKIWTEDSDGNEILVPYTDVHRGDTVIVRSGSMIPMDGEVFEGEAMISEAAMTGEPMAVLKSHGNSVFAGTIVEEGMLKIKVRETLAESRISKIVELINNSENNKAEIQSQAEKRADSIVPLTFALAIGAYLFTGNITKAISALMVDYSCAIKLSIPICVISAMRETANNKILVKGGKFFEEYANADTVIFDKTGTLTSACPIVAKVVPLGDWKRDDVLRTAACLEEHFPHSVAKAIVNQAEKENLIHKEEHAEVEYIVAHGIASSLNGNRAIIGSGHFVFDDENICFTKTAQTIQEKELLGMSVIYLAVNGNLVGMIGIEDTLKPNVKNVIDGLKKRGIKNIIMMTGDGKEAAQKVCDMLRITECYSQVLPENKAEMVEKLKSENHKVIMVGDGVNDSPALAAASVSVSMSSSSDIAKETADITLFSENLDALLLLRDISNALFKRIHNNYSFIVSFNSLLLALGLTGIITPQMSALMHNSSTFLLSGLSTKKYIE